MCVRLKPSIDFFVIIVIIIILAFISTLLFLLRRIEDNVKMAF